MVGLFVTSLVGLYTIEDLWDKFGDLKMSWVSNIKMRYTLTNRHIARSSETLGCTDCVPHSPPYPGIHVNFQDPLPDPQPLWSWRFANELIVSSKPHRK